MSVKGFHHVAVKSADFDKSFKFYTEILGLKCDKAWGEGDSRAVMLALDDGSSIELFAGGKNIESIQSPYIHLAFHVDCPDCFINKVREAGYPIIMEPKDVDVKGNPGFKARIAFCKGPNGEELEFFKTM